MPRQLVLLRGVNVGGRTVVPMARLRELLTDRGLTDVVTHLQSGNVVVGSRRSAASVERLVRSVIEAELGLSVPVTVRSAAEVDAVVAGDPFADVRTDDGRHGVVFLDVEPEPGRVDAAGFPSYLPDRCVVSGRELHLWCPAGFHETRLTNVFLERRLGVVATTRNWRTVLALHHLLGGG